MEGADHLLILRLGAKAAAVLIRTDGKSDKAGEHCFIEVEHAIDAAAMLDGACVSVACPVGENDLPVRTRLLRTGTR